VKLCDRLAYVGKDIEDAAESGIVAQEEIPPHIAEVLGKNNGEIIDSLVRDMVVNFHTDLREFAAANGRSPSRAEIAIRLSPNVLEALNTLIRDFNYPRIYLSKVSNEYSAQTERMLCGLFSSFVEELDGMAMPRFQQATLHRFDEDNGSNPLLSKTLGELEELTGSFVQADIDAVRAQIIRENLEGFKGSRNSILYFLAQMSEDYRVRTNNAQMAIDYITLMTDSVATAIFESKTIPRPVV
jgi:dGTP triphosphohydrolase